MSDFEQKNEENLTEVNKEIEAYLIKKMENPESVEDEDDEEDRESNGFMSIFFSSMTIIIILVALVRLSNVILQWFK